ncbi:hypothetical protein TNCV_938221 [Trichonephila clavipes]|nr:hypothetical protein TNCV_938221 [Trichonephila clavipes]
MIISELQRRKVNTRDTDPVLAWICFARVSETTTKADWFSKEVTPQIITPFSRPVQRATVRQDPHATLDVSDTYAIDVRTNLETGLVPKIPSQCSYTMIERGTTAIGLNSVQA